MEKKDTDVRVSRVKGLSVVIDITTTSCIYIFRVSQSIVSVEVKSTVCL